MRISFFKPKKNVTLFIVAIKNKNQKPPSNADDFLMDRMNSKGANACQLINTIWTIIFNLVHAHKHTNWSKQISTLLSYTQHTHLHTIWPGIYSAKSYFLFSSFQTNTQIFSHKLKNIRKLAVKHLDQKINSRSGFCKMKRR